MSNIPYKLFFSTLGNETRLKIVLSLRKSPKNVSQITKELGYDQTTVSHGLQKLMKCHFVKMEKRGKERYYSLNADTVGKMLDILERHERKYCRDSGK